MIDVAVVGSGPGGITAALFLKHLGARGELSVNVLERLGGDRYETYHRMCGEGISRRAFKHLDPVKPIGVINEIDRIDIRWPSGTVSGYNDKGYIINRAEFLKAIRDDFLDLGGRITNQAVSSVKTTDEGYELETRSGEIFTCGYLIGADGSNSLVRKSVFHEDPPYKAVLQQFLVDGEVDDHTITFYPDSRYNGEYRWEFPCGDMIKIGFPVGTDHVEEYIERHSRPICFGGLSTIVKDKTMLVGDAAGQANPITMGGIRVAMEAGKRAAMSILKGDLRSYQRWWDGCGFNAPRFLKAHLRARTLSNEYLNKISRPFSRPFGTLQHIYNFIRNPEDRPLYTTYLTLPLYGW